MIRGAAAIADDLYRWLIDEHGLAGHTELAVARGAGAARAGRGRRERLRFRRSWPRPTTARCRTPMPRDVEIPRDTLVVVDLGCMVDGYCSDCTRTFATGELGAEAAEVYELVRSAQAAAARAVRAGAEAQGGGRRGARADRARPGRGELFGHGTGHGVGLEVHEAPRIAPSVEDGLEAGNVVTVEPGVYVPGAVRRADRGPGRRTARGRTLRGAHRPIPRANQYDARIEL